MKILTSISLSLTFTVIAHGAELQLRDEVRTAGPLVLLGDIADIHARHSAEAAQLAVIDLLPVPAAGEERVLRLREVQDLLAVRGVNLAEHRFSGASEVAIYGPKRDAAAPPRQLAERPRAVASAKPLKQPIVDAVQAVIEAHLNNVAGEEGWKIDFDLTDDRIQRIAELGQQLVATGGEAPWTGKQRFLVGAENSDLPAVPITVETALPPAVVVVRYSLPKGVILRADDVKLQRGLPTRGEAEVYQSIEDVVGRETTRMVAEGQILDSRSVRRPLLVRRNEIVSVYSRSAGINVRTTARVRDDGANGDLVTVETLENRKPFFARVCGPQEVEVFAQASAATETSSSPASRDNGPYHAAATTTSTSDLNR